MIHRLIGLVIIAIAVIVGLSHYLSPDDLKDCPQPGSGQCQKAGAIIVISGGDTEARTAEAVKLYQAGWAPTIILSGAAADKSGPSNAAAMRKQAEAAGVPAAALVMDERSETTKQNAQEVANIIAQRGIKRVILVTSGYHMRRALAEFSAQLPNVELWARPTTHDKHWSAWWWLTPWGWWLAVGELLRIGLFALGVSR